jgi:hypothetical protein
MKNGYFPMRILTMSEAIRIAGFLTPPAEAPKFKKFFIKFIGIGHEVEALDAEDAWKRIRNHLDCYVIARSVGEIGTQVDAEGVPLGKEPKGKVLINTKDFTMMVD